MQKILIITTLTILIGVCFTSPAINVDWTPTGPNDTVFFPGLMQDGPSIVDAGKLPGKFPTRSAADSLALVVGGLVMLFSASLLKRLAH